jgi:chromosomal replication initiation ATPase DnaA
MGEIMEKIDLKKIKQNIKNKPPKLILYGGAGIGKTTFAGSWQSKPKRKNKKSKFAKYSPRSNQDWMNCNPIHSTTYMPKLITTRKR